MKKDQVTGALATVMGILVAVATVQMPDSGMRNDIGPKVFPAICAAGLIISGLCTLLKGHGKSGGGYTRRELKRLGCIGGVVFAYVVLMDLLGFLIPTVIILYIICTMFAENLAVARWKRVLFSAAVTTAIYVIFEKLMLLRLPVGRFF